MMDDPERRRRIERLKNELHKRRALDEAGRRMAADPYWRAAQERMKDPEWRRQFARWQEANDLLNEAARELAREEVESPPAASPASAEPTSPTRSPESAPSETPTSSEAPEPTSTDCITTEDVSGNPETSIPAGAEEAQPPAAPMPSDEEVAKEVIREVMRAVFKEFDDRGEPWPNWKAQWPQCGDKINSDRRLTERGIRVSRDDLFDKVANEPEFKAKRRLAGKHR